MTFAAAIFINETVWVGGFSFDIREINPLDDVMILDSFFRIFSHFLSYISQKRYVTFG